MSNDRSNNRQWVEVDRRILRTKAGPDEAWAAWARPERLSQWFPDEARGEPVGGGELVHVWSSFGGMEISHRVLEAEPGRRLLLEGESPMGLSFRQEIIVERDGDETIIKLIHYGFGDDASWEGEYEGIDSGWQLALAVLRHYLEEHFGQGRRVIAQMRSVAMGIEAVQPYFRTREGLAEWLAGEGSLADKAVGDAVSLKLLDDGRLTGALLADSGRELALTWEEINGVLELKAFPMGPDQNMVGLRVSAWGMDSEAKKRLESGLAAAADRLAQIRSG